MAIDDSRGALHSCGVLAEVPLVLRHEVRERLDHGGILVEKGRSIRVAHRNQASPGSQEIPPFAREEELARPVPAVPMLQVDIDGEKPPSPTAS